MLSDGAAAFFMTNKKNEKGISLRVEWIEGFSYANEMEACMYMAGEKQKDGTLKVTWIITPRKYFQNPY